jgi:hypothetical protein
MLIQVDLDDTSDLRLEDDLTTSAGVTGIIVHVQDDHVIIDTDKTILILAVEGAGRRDHGTNECGQPATAQGAQDGTQNAKDAE